jgi:NAD(P)-dependent dehydrogenase (short-subunit alcohol dehydrogenase family)
VAAALSGKVVVIIGGTSGIGLAAARACVEAGARVVAVGRDDESIAVTQCELGESAHIFGAEACDAETASRAIDEATRTFRRFDALYHVAGGSGRKFGDGPLHELTDEGWAKTLDLNLTSVMLSNRAAVRQFLAQGTPGSILNLASVLATHPSPHHFATHAYAAAKAAIIGFSRSIAAAYAPHDIRVNVLAPGLVDTPMAQRAAQDDAIRAFIRTKQPLAGGRIGNADDLAAAAVFFLSEQSRFCTGQVLAVDGGWSVSEGQYA